MNEIPSVHAGYSFLFSKEPPLPDYLERKVAEMLDEIDRQDRDYIARTDPANLAGYFSEKYRRITPVLHVDQITTSETDTSLDISHDPSRVIDDRGGPIIVPGIMTTLHVPFTGDSELFEYTLPLHFTVRPFCKLTENEVAISHSWTRADPDATRAALNRQLDRLRDCLAQVESLVTNFNQALRARARERIEARQRRFRESHEVVKALGFPLRERDNVPKIYVAPVHRRKLPLPLPSVPLPAQEEWVLSMEHYEFILGLMNGVGLMIERNPAVFAQLEEEHLRTLFLLPLNSHYEGQATGETFNMEGKTDILIRAAGRNIFIAECKKWNGPKTLTDAIDQLRKYLTWRDTKTAIVLFSDRRRFGDVLAQIPEVLRKHPSYKREWKEHSESTFYFKVSQEREPALELYLTVLVFDVPARVKKTAGGSNF